MNDLERELDLARRKVAACRKALKTLDELREELERVQEGWEQRMYAAQEALHEVTLEDEGFFVHD